MEATIKVQGMTCGGCVNSVTKAAQRVAGVEEAKVSLEKGEAVVTFDEARTSAQKISEAITEAGYTASVN